jgi:hypothetical protein
MKSLYDEHEEHTPRAQYIFDTVAGFVAGAIDSYPDVPIRELQNLCMEAVMESCNQALAARRLEAARESLRKQFLKDLVEKKIVKGPSSDSPSEGSEG